METWSVINNKGGVGKTVTSVLLAEEASLRGMKVLAVDADPQANLSEALLGEQPGGVSLPEALQFPREYARKALRSCSWWDGEIKLDVLPCSERLGTLEFRQEALHEVLVQIGHDYDLILVDTPPSLGPAARAALKASDRIIIPAGADRFALRGIGAVVKGVRDVRPGLEDTLRVLITLFDSRVLSQREKADEITAAYPVVGRLGRVSRIADNVSSGRPWFRGVPRQQRESYRQVILALLPA